jgi:RHS repeat-associated protein
MTSPSFDSRIVIRILAGIALLLSLFLAADYLIPGAKAKKYGYDKKGRLTSLTTLNGRVIKYSYDKAGLLIAISYHKLGGITNFAYPAGDSVTFDYDAAGNRVSMKDRLGKTQYGYDDFNRPSQVTTFNNKKLSYEYDNWNQIKRILFPDGYKLQYGRDLAGNITRLSDGDAVVNYEYHVDSNQVIRKLPNGISTIYQYSALGQLASIRHLLRDDQPLCAYSYEYDSEGHISKLAETTTRGTEITNYEYDLLGRVAKVTQPDGSTVTYEYDSMGNRTSETGSNGTTHYQYDAQGKLVEAGEMRFAYDNVGNLVSKKDKTRSITYRYDDENRLLEVNSGKNKIQYSYDGEGNRVRRELNGRVTNYLNETVMEMPQVVAEYGASGNMSHYLLGQSRVGKRNANGEAVYFLEDHLGSTRYVVDATGKVLSRYSYSVFGVPKLTEGQPETEASYTGESWDPEANLLYLRARYYDPELGRFLSPDPNPGSPSSPETFNQFVYVSNDPVNHTDPLGLQMRPPTPAATPRIGVPSPAIPPAAQTSGGFSWHELSQGSYFGTRYGDVAALHWAQRYEQTGNKLYYIPGLLSSLWTPDTWKDTALTLGPEVAAKGIGMAFRPWARNAYAAADAADVERLLGGEKVHQELLGRYVHLGVDKPGLHIGITLPEWGNKLVGYPLRKGVVEASEGSAFIHLRETHLNIGGPRFQPPGFSSPVSGFDIPWPVVGLIAEGTRLTEHMRQGYSRELQDRLEDPSLTADQSHNIFLPPGGGGGGSSVPNVGGVYLDQAAQVIGQLGTITGATYDPASGRLSLIGDKTTTLPPMKPEYLAEAIRVVYSDRENDPGMTIDPNPKDPEGPIMNVIFFGNTENTHLGSVMFEADRVMKGYSVGSDNITKQPVVSSIPGYLSTAAIRLRDGYPTTGLWSRFWLVPEPLSARVSDDGRTIMFDPVKMRVKTETMKWENGKLVSAGEVKNPAAEIFADHFTKHYDDFARENSTYAELKQVTQAVALAKWMKQQNIPVDWRFVRLYAGQPYTTPTTTPSAFAELSEKHSDGTATWIRTLSTLGGVDMVPEIQSQKAPVVDGFHKELTAGSATAQQQGQLSFSFKFDKKEFEAVSLPGTEEREVASYDLTESEADECLKIPPELAQLPGLTRYYNSSHNEPTEYGFSWSLLLPRLEIETPEENGKTHYLSVVNDSTTQVLVQKFLLTNQFGLAEERFSEGSVDQDMKRIVFKPDSGSEKYRGVYPESDGNYRVIFNSGDQALFDSKGTLRAIVKPKQQVLYDYDSANHLTSIRLKNGDDEEVVMFAVDVKGRLASVSSGDRRVDYDYDQAGNLGAAKCGARTASYGYNDKRLLVEVSLNGQVISENSYDDFGRLLQQKDEAGAQILQKVETTPAGKVLTIEDGADFAKKIYDAHDRLVTVEDSGGGKFDYSYDQAGRISHIEERLPNGGLAKTEISADRRTVTIQDPRGVRNGYLFNDRNQIAETTLNGKRIALYRYDDQGKLSGVSYDDGGSETFTYDAHGRVREYQRREAEDGNTDPSASVNFSYDEQGGITGIGTGAPGQVSFAKQPGEAIVTSGNASTRYQYVGEHLAKIEGPEESAVAFSYRSDGALAGVDLFRGRGHRRLELTNNSVVNSSENGARTIYSYGPTGLLESVQDNYGVRTSYSYDAQNRLHHVELPNGRCVDYFYESATGRLREERSTACRK